MSYTKCSLCGEGPTIRHDTSGLCQACKIKTGLTEREAKERVVSYWRQVTGIEPGMIKSEALARFTEFKDNPTCRRCEGNSFKQFCTANLICEQAYDEEVIKNVGGDDNRNRVDETDESQTFRVELSQARKRDAVRQPQQNQTGLSRSGLNDLV